MRSGATPSGKQLLDSLTEQQRRLLIGIGLEHVKAQNGDLQSLSDDRELRKLKGQRNGQDVSRKEKLKEDYHKYAQKPKEVYDVFVQKINGKPTSEWRDGDMGRFFDRREEPGFLISYLTEEQKNIAALIGSEIYDTVYPRWWGGDMPQSEDELTVKVVHTVPRHNFLNQRGPAGQAGRVQRKRGSSPVNSFVPQQPTSTYKQSYNKPPPQTQEQTQNDDFSGQNYPTYIAQQTTTGQPQPQDLPEAYSYQQPQKKGIPDHLDDRQMKETLNYYNHPSDSEAGMNTPNQDDSQVPRRSRQKKRRESRPEQLPAAGISSERAKDIKDEDIMRLKSREQKRRMPMVVKMPTQRSKRNKYSVYDSGSPYSRPKNYSSGKRASNSSRRPRSKKSRNPKNKNKNRNKPSYLDNNYLDNPLNKMNLSRAESKIKYLVDRDKKLNTMRKKGLVPQYGEDFEDDSEPRNERQMASGRGGMNNNSDDNLFALSKTGELNSNKNLGSNQSGPNQYGVEEVKIGDAISNDGNGGSPTDYMNINNSYKTNFGPSTSSNQNGSGQQQQLQQGQGYGQDQQNFGPGNGGYGNQGNVDEDGNLFQSQDQPNNFRSAHFSELDTSNKNGNGNMGGYGDGQDLDGTNQHTNGSNLSQSYARNGGASRQEGGELSGIANRLLNSKIISYLNYNQENHDRFRSLDEEGQVGEGQQYEDGTDPNQTNPMANNESFSSFNGNRNLDGSSKMGSQIRHERHRTEIDAADQPYSLSGTNPVRSGPNFFENGANGLNEGQFEDRERSRYVEQLGSRDYSMDSKEKKYQRDLAYSLYRQQGALKELQEVQGEDEARHLGDTSSSFSSFNPNDEMKSFFRKEFAQKKRMAEESQVNRSKDNCNCSMASSNLSYSYGKLGGVRHQKRDYGRPREILG